MEKSANLSEIVGYKASTLSIKNFKAITEAIRDQIKIFVTKGSFTDSNGITYKCLSKDTIDDVLKLAAQTYTTHNPLMSLFEISAHDAEEYFEEEFCDEANEYSEMSIVAMKAGKVIGVIINDDEFDLEEEEEDGKKDPKDDEPYPNKELDDFAHCLEEIFYEIDETMDIEAKDECENAYITALAVDPEYFRTGVASNLFKISLAVTLYYRYKRLMTCTLSGFIGDKLEDLGFAKMCKGIKASEFELEDGDSPFEEIKEDFTVTYHGIDLV